MGGREDLQLLLGAYPLAGQRVDDRDRLDLVAEQLDAHRRLLVRRVDLDDVAAHPKLAPHQIEVVSLVLHVDQAAQQLPLIDRLPHPHRQQLAGVVLGRTQAVDAADRGDDDHIPTGEQRGGGRVPQPVDVVVHRAVLLDEGIAGGDVGLGLVVVVVADEVLHPVVGEELAVLVGQLCGQALVGRQHQGGPLHLLDHPRNRGRLTRAGDAQQRLVALAGLDALGQRSDRLRLVARRLERSVHLEGAHHLGRSHRLAQRRWDGWSAGFCHGDSLRRSCDNPGRWDKEGLSRQRPPSSCVQAVAGRWARARQSIATAGPLSVSTDRLTRSARSMTRSSTPASDRSRRTSSGP